MSKPFTLKTERPTSSWWGGAEEGARRPLAFDSYEAAYREGRNYGGDFVVLENGRPFLQFKDGIRSYTFQTPERRTTSTTRKAAHRSKGRHRFRRNVARSRKSTPAESFDLALASYVARLQAQERSNDSLTIEPSKRYTRIVRTSGSVRSVVSFIDKNGDILKPASWKGPAKGVRGNIFKLT